MCIRDRWNAYKQVTESVNRLNPRLQGRLGGKFALPSTKAKLAIGAPVEDPPVDDDNNDDDNEAEDDDAQYVDMEDDDDRSSKASSSGKKGRRKSRGKGPRKHYRN